jgi:hypothetical protein
MLLAAELFAPEALSTLTEVKDGKPEQKRKSPTQRGYF